MRPNARRQSAVACRGGSGLGKGKESSGAGGTGGAGARPPGPPGLPSGGWSFFLEPVRFFDLLVRRVLVHFDRRPQLSVLCCRCLERLYCLHRPVIGMFDDMMVLVDLLSQASHREMRHGLLLLVAELSANDEDAKSKTTFYITPVLDSSRYFRVSVKDPRSDRVASLGIGFREKEAAYSFTAALQDFARSVR